MNRDDINERGGFLSEYRSKMQQRRKRLNDFYFRHALRTPTKAELVFFLVLWIFGILPLVIYSDVFKTPVNSEYYFVYLLIVGSTITVTNLFISYVRGRAKK